MVQLKLVVPTEFMSASLVQEFRVPRIQSFACDIVFLATESVPKEAKITGQQLHNAVMEDNQPNPACQLV